MDLDTNENYSVLLLDDDESFCKIVQKQAEKCGIEITYVTRFKDLEALDNIDDFSTVWLDYDLVETTGLEVAEYLESNHPKIPVVLVSSSNRPFAEEENKRKNIKGFLSKWDLTDDDISRDLMESAKGEFHNDTIASPGQVLNQEEEPLTESLQDHFSMKVPQEKYRA